MTQKCKIAFHVSRHHEVLVCWRQHMNVPAGQRLQLTDILNANKTPGTEYGFVAG